MEQVTVDYLKLYFSLKMEKFEKQQIWCTDCARWTNLDEWLTIDLYCETCGGYAHFGISHEKDQCLNYMDNIYDELRIR